MMIRTFADELSSGKQVYKRSGFNALQEKTIATSNNQNSLAPPGKAKGKSSMPPTTSNQTTRKTRQRRHQSTKVRTRSSATTDQVTKPTIRSQTSTVTTRRPTATLRATEPVSMSDDDDDVVVSTPTYEDIDRNDGSNPQMTSEYVNLIYDYLGQCEIKHKVDKGYMLRQLDIHDGMRKILVNWMIEVSIEFQLMSETLFLSVAILDQYLQKKQVSRANLQLVGMACMFIASKYEEIWHPPIEDFVYICASTYSREQILKTEIDILQSLNFDLSQVTPLQFVRRFSKAAHSDPRLHTCCKFFAEISLASFTMLAFPPSQIAASAVYLSRKLAGKKPVWNDTLQHYSKYSERDLLPSVKALIYLLRNESKLGREEQSPVVEKYAHNDFYRVSTTILDFYRRRSSRSSQRSSSSRR
mmetsp:Transcript_19021/g.28329  ORF Transcript_19021/g.28329 Transcript_19021/m.28329 type:complete len:414 (-) Transcript_19021:41-1282(-)